MPPRKRALEDFDPNKSDPEDEDYDVSATQIRGAKPSRSRKSKPARKRRRTGRTASESEGVSETEPSSDESFVEEQEYEEPEIDPRTGRPMRKVSKNRPQYVESDGDSVDFMNEIDESDIGEHSNRRKNTNSLKKKLIVTLKANPAPPEPKRSSRVKSGSVSSKQPVSSELGVITRRSSRITRDNTEGLFALTNSGNHVEVTRDPTKSPETFSMRPTRAAKGLKKPPANLPEVPEDSFIQADTEPHVKESFDQQDAETAASREDFTDTNDGPEKEHIENHENIVQVHSDMPHVDSDDADDIDTNTAAIVPESNDEEDDDVQIKPRRSVRQKGQAEADDLGGQKDDGKDSESHRASRRSLRSAAQAQPEPQPRGKKRGLEDTSDFEPGIEDGAEDDISSSSESNTSRQKASQERSDSSLNARRSKRLKTNGRNVTPVEHDSEEADELREELQELRQVRPRRTAKPDKSFDDRPLTRKRKPVDYRILRSEQNFVMEEDGAPAAATPSRKGRAAAGGGWQRSLFSIEGPFGGAGGPPPVLGGPIGAGAIGGVDSDSSDDEALPRQRPAGVGGAVGMTPTTAAPPGFNVFPAAQTHSADALQNNLGRVKDKQALADSDPLGVDPNVNFDGVGGLDGHIDQLKEMVALPLLYPEIFQRFRVTPPRGVLFHGPPGTGKTLLARALASSISSSGRKVTFYMRKGADALSKWVGEAERQLRLLFEEARKNQPSIIFFDEIDGLAPVRSSKQEQIHASIVSTLLALMDGMDGRGQVIVIGATNRPDSVDPALRRPGRFDREFYFPLPNKEARRKILDIHTTEWKPPVTPTLKDELAELTKGYGGADLRALCTEAALNAVQRRYPQIYSSNEKLLIKPETINIAAKDFMISLKRIIPSSERSTSSGASPLPKSVEPLLKQQLREIEQLLADTMPTKKRLTALEEAKFEDSTRDDGIRSERMLQEFERSRIFRPRLLLRGNPGMGQQYIVSALLHHFEGLHVQTFDLPTLLSDSTRSPEAATVQFFTEVKRHKPSVIYIPNVDTWYSTIGNVVVSTFTGLLRTLSPSDPVLVLGYLEGDVSDVDPQMIRDLFGFATRNQYYLSKPSRDARRAFFNPVIDYLKTTPEEFPEPANRKQRVLEKLDVAPPDTPKSERPLTKEEVREQKRKDRHTLNVLKIRIQPIMEQIKKYKRFRTGVVDENAIRYLFDEENPAIVTSDAPHELRAQVEFRPYEKATDDHGEPGLRETSSGKFFYNMEIVTIEKRLQNGFYKRPKDFVHDIKKLTKDARALGDQERLIRAQELQANVEVDVASIEIDTPAFAAECEALYQRETRRQKDDTHGDSTAINGEGERPPTTTNLGTSPTDHNAPPPLVNGSSHDNSTDPRNSNQSSITNGISDLSDLQGQFQNKHSDSNHSKSEDIHMTNSEDTPTPNGTQSSSFGPSAQTRPLHFDTGAPASLQQRASLPGSLSQKGVITPMAEGSHPHMYENSASTTSSDKRLTGSSGPFATPSVRYRQESQSMPAKAGGSQSSNGRIEEGPELSMLLNHPSHQFQLQDSQGDLPQTQVSAPNSSQSQPLSQHRPQVPASQPTRGAISSLLNQDPVHPHLVIDHASVQQFWEQLVTDTSQCTVEQLEQIYSGIMNEIWRTRGSWNRASVVEKARSVFSDLLADMQSCQYFGPGSHDSME